MDLRQLECFIAVADELHFGRAAERLYLSQPTVSESIRRLELELGGSLFERSTRRVRLTDLGVAFLGEATKAYVAVQDAYETGRRLARRPPGQLAVGYTIELGPQLMRVIPALGAMFPDIEVQLRMATTQRQLAGLAKRTLDVAICWEPEAADDRCSTIIDRSPLVAMVPDGHPIADNSTATLREIAGEPLIAFPRSLNPRAYDLFASALDATGESWSITGNSVGIDNVASRVLAGHGVGIVFATFASFRALEGVSCIPLEPELLSIERHAVWLCDNRNPAVPAFVELLQQIVRRDKDDEVDRSPNELPEGARDDQH